MCSRISRLQGQVVLRELADVVPELLPIVRRLESDWFHLVVWFHCETFGSISVVWFHGETPARVVSAAAIAMDPRIVPFLLSFDMSMIHVMHLSSA